MTELADRPAETLEQLLAEKYEPIAVVGVGLRFPGGCDSADEFEEFLREGRSGIAPLPTDRWDVDAFTPAEPGEKGKIHTTGGGFLDRIDRFDAAFFNISPKEAQYIDPQQRMLLETAWQALEHANIDPTALRRGNGGVYVGASSIDYALEIGALPYTELDGHLASGITMFPLSGRLSYFLGWRGPSVSVDTACSSSLTALHMAVQGLRRGECDIALCGGVNALHHPCIPVIFSHGQMLAPDGQCKTFDDGADGYVRAEGCGVVVLKRLSAAVAAGDTVLSVIRGTAVGQDGDSAGLTVPNGVAQEEVIRTALAAARLEPGDIQYVEAHGTGTPLGDPIELGAINDVFANSHTKEEPLLVGSVKTNLGHMEPASGIVGLIKTTLQLRSATIYPHLNLTTPSRRIPWDMYPVTVPTTSRPWSAPVRRAVVNSFGFAGTIAAVVLEQPPEVAPEPVVPAHEAVGQGHVFTLSAKGEAALRAQVEIYQRFLAENPDVDLGRLCYTRNVGRAHHGHRLAGVVADRDRLAALLAKAADGLPPVTPTGVRKVCFMFTGQGAQYAGMGADLYRRFPVFRRYVDECDELFSAELGRSVRDQLLGEVEDPKEIDQTWLTQSALFTVEYALARLWMSWGVRPNVLIGHSIGEVVAAAVSGLFSLPDAVRLVAARGRLMQSVSAPGGMAAVQAPAEEVEPLLAGRPDLALAAVNGPGQCVISGGQDNLDAVVAILKEQGLRVDRLAVSHAFHSPLMTEVFEEFRAAIAEVTFREPAISIMSNLTGAVARVAELSSPDYWVRHIGEPVRFLDGMRAIAKRGKHAMIEIGPSGTLTALAKQCVTPEDHHWFVSLRRREQSADVTLRALAGLYAVGLPVSWPGVHADRPERTIALPTYGFQRKRYWLPLDATAQIRSAEPAGPAHHPLLGRETEATGHRAFAAELTAARPAPLADHVVGGAVVMPATGYVELMLAVQDEVFGHCRGTVLDLRLHEPLEPGHEDALTVRTLVHPRDDGGLDVRVVSGSGETEVLHATATVVEEPTGGTAIAADDIPEPEGPADRVRDAADVYTDFVSVNRAYGPRLRLLDQVARHGATITADLVNRQAGPGEHAPVDVLECAVQAVSALHEAGPGVVPVAFGSVRMSRRPRGERLRVRARLRPSTDGGQVGLADLLLFDGDRIVVEMRDVALAAPGDAFTHRLEWLRASTPEPATATSPRHVLALHTDPAQEAALATTDDVTVTLVAGPDRLAEALRDPTVTDVSWFWRCADGPMTIDRLRAESEENYRDLLATVAAVEGGAGERRPRLWLVTERGQWLPGDRADTGEQLAAASLWGFGPVLLTEYPQYRATLVDLAGPDDLAGLVRQWKNAGSDEFQLAFRAGQRYVRRLLAGETPPGDFEVRAPGDAPVPVDEAPPTDCEIQVEVTVAALTSTDGTGATCVGTVRAAGPEAGFVAGDLVVVDRAGPVRRLVTLPGTRALRIPDGLDPAVAARVVAGVADRGDLAAELALAAAGPPASPFELDEADEAFRQAGQGTPVLLRLDRTTEPSAPADVRVRPDRTYVITGGLGGLGLATARKLVELGARHLTLVSRSGRPTPEAEELLGELADRAEFALVRADVGTTEGMARLVDELQRAPHSVGGFVHAAGAIGKELIAKLDWAAIDEQLAPKVYGGWLLHEASAAFPEHEFFVVYSSIAAVIGGATQGHYAAASAYLDGLAEWRSRQGLPGLGISWGAWARVGMSARLDDQLSRELDRSGIRFFSPARALETLAELWRRPVSHRVVGQYDWDRIASAGALDNALYSRLVQGRSADQNGSDLRRRLLEPEADRIGLISALVRGKVAESLHLDDADDLDASIEFVSLGLDSLMAQELKSGLEAELRIPLPASLTFDHPSPQQLVEFLDRQIAAELLH